MTDQTDQTPVTDDDRLAHRWESEVEKHPSVYGELERATARAIRAHVPAPQLIRTPAELEALDPDSIVLDRSGHLLTHRDRLPAVVVASGEHVRACREALEGETT